MPTGGSARGLRLRLDRSSALRVSSAISSRAPNAISTPQSIALSGAVLKTDCSAGT